MKKEKSISKLLLFKKKGISELNDNQLFQIKGADLGDAVKSAVVSFTNNTFDTNVAVSAAIASFYKTLQLWLMS